MTYFILEVLAARGPRNAKTPTQEGASYSGSAVLVQLYGQVLGDVRPAAGALRDPSGWQTDMPIHPGVCSDLADAPMRPEAGKRYLLLACTYDRHGVGGAMRDSPPKFCGRPMSS